MSPEAKFCGNCGQLVSAAPTTQKLTNQLTSESRQERYAAVNKFSDNVKADAKAVDILLELAQKEDEWDMVRRGSMEALGKSKDIRALPLLLEYAEAHPDKGTQYMAIIGLGYMGDPSALEVLNRCLASSNDQIRRNAAVALGEIHDPRSIEPLIRALKDRRMAVKNEAVIELGKLGDSKAVLPIAECYWDLQGDVRVMGKETWELFLRNWEKKGDKSSLSSLIGFIELDTFNELIVNNMISSLGSIRSKLT
jgi:HEAT repeat protein